MQDGTIANSIRAGLVKGHHLQTTVVPPAQTTTGCRKAILPSASTSPPVSKTLTHIAHRATGKAAMMDVGLSRPAATRALRREVAASTTAPSRVQMAPRHFATIVMVEATGAGHGDPLSPQNANCSKLTITPALKLHSTTLLAV